eukprot:TRINITY_DN2545_c0_g1_i1.p1 TRINITY_DN2545_c0_g1~~TRINITY_DN2545_c0_g1_i1.p1  ORF type:complete len:428 (+),score=86.01 TRINITY_DN2545_c0_g1_i1:158-1441(+)
MAKSKGEIHYEFNGPPGALMTMIFLPLTIYFFYFQCRQESGCLSLSPDIFSQILSNLPSSDTIFFTWTALGVTSAWILFQAVLYMVIPGEIQLGTKLADGSHLEYKINALRCMAVSTATLLILHLTGIISLVWIYYNFVPLITSSIILASSLSVYLYARSYRMKTGLANGGNTGSIIYDFFIGHELNPRILNGRFDLKYFCELRPGLIGWVVVDWAMMLAQYERYGQVTNSMMLVCLFQTWYVVDALKSEKAILTTMDITTDGFGYMLAFGDLAWVPFTYTLQSRYLVEFPHVLSYWMIAVIIVIKTVGFGIFRAANGEKDTFRTNPDDPSVSNLRYIKTEIGSKLLTSGWWGMSRHINYFGDILMGLAWCLPCGFEHILPYYYCIYFVILLVHRERRDNHKCSVKYGKDWDKYCSIVKYRIVPYLY